MDITLEIINEKEEIESVTFYSIEAIGKGPKAETSTIYTNSMKFTCNLPLAELWSKLRNIDKK
jgi:hypothetical protein